MNTASKSVVVLAALLVIAAVGWLMLLREEPGPDAPPVVTPVTPQAASVRPPAAAVRAPPVTQPQCEGTPLTLVLDGKSQIACGGPLDTMQNGSVRTYRVEMHGESARWLRIDAIGTRVLSVALGGTSARAPDFRCKESSCSGVSISRHDAQGVRTISLSNLRLRPAHSGDDAWVSGEIRTHPEDQVAGASCPDQGLSIVTSDGSVSAFCPNGGAGFELGDDGNRTYRFTNLDGASILVALDEAQRVQQVRYEGDDTLACRGSTCGHVGVSAADAKGPRTFTFAGTTLIESSAGEHNAVLNGTLVVPPL